MIIDKTITRNANELYVSTSIDHNKEVWVNINGAIAYTNQDMIITNNKITITDLGFYDDPNDVYIVMYTKP
jgi:hypothetical protein